MTYYAIRPPSPPSLNKPKITHLAVGEWKYTGHLFCSSTDPFGISSYCTYLLWWLVQDMPWPALWDYISFRLAMSFLSKHPWFPSASTHVYPDWKAVWTVDQWGMEANMCVTISLFCLWDMYYKTLQKVFWVQTSVATQWRLTRQQNPILFLSLALMSSSCPTLPLPGTFFPNKLLTFLWACFLWNQRKTKYG